MAYGRVLRRVGRYAKKGTSRYLSNPKKVARHTGSVATISLGVAFVQMLQGESFEDIKRMLLGDPGPDGKWELSELGVLQWVILISLVHFAWNKFR